MRKLWIPFHSLILFALCTCAWANSESRELGHHWEDPAYIGEVRIQIVVMAAIACVIAAASFIRMTLKNRRAGR